MSQIKGATLLGKETRRNQRIPPSFPFIEEFRRSYDNARFLRVSSGALRLVRIRTEHMGPV